MKLKLSFRPYLFTGLALPVVLIVSASGAPQSSPLSQDTELRKEVDGLKAEVKSLRADLEQIKQTLRDLTEPRAPVFDITGAPAMGDEKAKLVLIEFSDYQCPYCMDYFTNTYQRLLANYVKTGKVKYVARDFPGESIHPNALQAAEAARCATEQGKFWLMHDSLFRNQKELGSTGIAKSAADAGLDINKFNSCYASNKYLDPVRKDEDETVKLGVKGTPAFFLGTPDPANPSKIKLAKALIGSQPWSAFQQTIDGLLAK